MKRFLRTLFFTLTVIVLAACSISQGVTKTSSFGAKASSSPYLSITLTAPTDKGLMICFFTYDLATKKIEEIGKVPLTAQYALGAIDRKTMLYTIQKEI